MTLHHHGQFGVLAVAMEEGGELMMTLTTVTSRYNVRVRAG